VTSASPRVRRAQPRLPGERTWISRWAAPAPALVTMIGIALFAISVTFQQSSRIESRYREEANNALTVGDYTTARLCYERLLQTTQTDPSLWYGLARSLDGLHQLSESQAILMRIAPADKPGYLPAQLWLAEQLLESGHDDQTNRLAERYLRQVIDEDPGNLEAQSFLSALSAKRHVSDPAK